MKYRADARALSRRAESRERRNWRCLVAICVIQPNQTRSKYEFRPESESSKFAAVLSLHTWHLALSLSSRALWTLNRGHQSHAVYTQLLAYSRNCHGYPDSENILLFCTFRVLSSLLYVLYTLHNTRTSFRHDANLARPCLSCFCCSSARRRNTMESYMGNEMRKHLLMIAVHTQGGPAH